MKIIFGINVPYQSTEIDFEATEKKKQEMISKGEFPAFSKCVVRIPCIRHRDLFFEMCEYCGGQVTGGRLKRGWRSCSKECHDKVGSAWAHHTLIKEKETKGKRPVFFWNTIREECFKRDDYTCQNPECGKKRTFELVDFKITKGGKEEILQYRKWGDEVLLEAHHIVPICEGGSNELSNLKTLCYECHKKEHSKEKNTSRKHKCLCQFGVTNA